MMMFLGVTATIVSARLYPAKNQLMMATVF